MRQIYLSEQRCVNLIPVEMSSNCNLLIMYPLILLSEFLAFSNCLFFVPSITRFYREAIGLDRQKG
jgi:hypothetical protein